MRSGTLKEVIKFYKEAGISDNYGGETPGEVLYWTTNAEVKPLKPKRDLETGQITQTAGYNIKARYREDKTPDLTMTIKYRGQNLIIQSVLIWDQEFKQYNIIALSNK